MMRPEWLALLAFVPLVVGPAPEGNNAITAALCGGGTITIPLGEDGDDQPPPQSCFKGCHAGTCRKRSGKSTDLELT
ncbi:hypothetical protein [Alteriqipengyuania sp. 357]